MEVGCCVCHNGGDHVVPKSGHGMKYEGTSTFLTIFRCCLFVVVDSMTYVNPCANAFRISTIMLFEIVAPCDLWLVIAYARTIGNDVL